MFEIPDDDDFWESLPMEDITNVTTTTAVVTGQKRLGNESPKQPNKKLRIDANVETLDKNNHVLLIQNEANSYQLSLSKATVSVPVNHLCTQPKSVSTSNNNDSISPLGEISNEVDGRQVNLQNLKSQTNSSTKDTIPICGNINERYVGPQRKHDLKTQDQVMPSTSHHKAIPSRSQLKVNPVHDQHCNQSVGTSGTPRARKHETSRGHSKRKFPGPAGLLPRLNPGQSLEKVLIPGMSPQTRTEPPDDAVILSSQSTDDVFSDVPWCTLLDDLQEQRNQVLTSFSVSSSLQKASKKLLPDGKVALMLAVVESVDIQGPDASVVLKDKTAKVSGTMHRDVVKEYATDLSPGVALVLKQVSVVSPTIRTHYLNITHKNIVHLYGHKSSRSLGDITDFRKTLHRVIHTAINQPTVQQPVTPIPRKTSPELARSCSGDIAPFRPPQMSTPLRNHASGQGQSGSTTKYSSPRPCQLQAGNSSSPSSNMADTPSRKFSFKSISKSASNSPVLGASPALARTSTFQTDNSIQRNTASPSFSNSKTSFLRPPSIHQPTVNSRVDQSFKGCESTNGGSSTIMAAHFGPQTSEFRTNEIRTNFNQKEIVKTTEKDGNCAKNPNGDSDLWQDDLSDELLSQLSEDMF